MKPPSNSTIFPVCLLNFHLFSRYPCRAARHKVQVPFLHALNLRTFDPRKTVC
jgi:hypothetical protein